MKRLLLVLCLLFPVLAIAGPVQPLAASDVAMLLEPPAHGERIITVWALDCAYCEPNLEALAKLQRDHPRKLELVIVTTDSIERRQAIDARLRQMKLDGYPNLAYAEASPERLNFLLDPDWGGETPRVMVIRADGSRLGISGELTPAQLRKIL
jgi:iron complex outermembrane receptor protein